MSPDASQLDNKMLTIWAVWNALICRVEKHGELGDECAEVYVLYGKATLNLAVTKSAVLGGGAPEKKDDKPEPSGEHLPPADSPIG
jgi:hypothetical protein